jgi:hypothetical protein
VQRFLFNQLSKTIGGHLGFGDSTVSLPDDIETQETMDMPIRSGLDSCPKITRSISQRPEACKKVNYYACVLLLFSKLMLKQQ